MMQLSYPTKNLPTQAVFFDVDGVLLDSLPQHLQICRDEASSFGLTLQVPDVPTFRKQVAAGEKVSPMINFFLSVGFPPPYARRALADHERDFAEKYRPTAFAGTEAMLTALRRSGLRLGLVTSNVRANVEPILRPSIRHFDERCLFFFDAFDPPRSKSWCLMEGARLLGLSPTQCTYVGDQPSDESAAREVGCAFLGVTYGWGITDQTRGIELAHSVADLTKILLLRRAES